MVDHYYTENPSSKEDLFEISVSLKDDSFNIWSSNGLFSKSELDSASKLLIEKCVVNPMDKVLDLGCGYGVIGLSLLRKHKDLDVTFSDVNVRALHLTQMNLTRYGFNGSVVKSDLFNVFNVKESKKFDVILSNPPMAAGRDICFSLIEDSFKHLNKNGSLQIVARHNKGGKVLSEKMFDVFGNVEVLAIKSGFRVYRSIKK